MKNKSIVTIISISFFLSLLFLSSCKNDKDKDFKEEKVFTFYSTDLTEPNYFNDPIAKEITKKTGVTLKFHYPKLSSSEEISLMIVNESYPDLIFAKSDLTKLINAKGVISLDEYIEKYGTNIKKLYGDQLVKLRYTLDDPSIYTVGTYELKNNTYQVGGTMQIQNAVLKEFAYPKISTLEDYENLLLAYIKKYPEINGHKTIGLSLLTDDWYWLVGLSNPGNYLIGFPDDGQWIVDQDTMQVTYKFLHPEMHIFYKWLNKIYHKGLLDPESFTQNIDVWHKKLSNGYVLGTSYPHWGLQDIQKELQNNGLIERTFAYLSVTANKNYKDPSLKDYGYSGGWGIAISKNCEDPVAAFKFLDWMCSEEAQILTNWGIENINYYYDSQGKRISKTIDSKENGVGTWLYPFPEGGPGYIDSTGNSIGKNQKESVISQYTYVEKETLKAYGVDVWTDLFPSPEELGVSKHGQIWQYPMEASDTALIEKADNFVKKSLIDMILGPQENFDKAWKSMQKTLRDMGVEKVEQNVTHLIQTKKELWNLP